MLTATLGACPRASIISEMCPSCRAPIVGTNAIFLTGSTFDSTASGNGFSQEDNVAWPSSIYYTQKIDDRLSWGLAVNTPFGLKTQWGPAFDGRYISREANLVVEDRRFAAELRGRLRADIEHGARVVAKTRWFRQPLWKRIPNWIGYGLARFAIGMFGFGGRF